MDIFGWIVLIAIGIIGVGTLLFLSIPTALDIMKINSYKRKKKIEAAKVDTDARAQEQLARDAEIREADKKIADKKLELTLKKKEAKAEALEEKIKAQEEKDAEAIEVAEQVVQDTKKDTPVENA